MRCDWRGNGVETDDERRARCNGEGGGIRKSRLRKKRVKDGEINRLPEKGITMDSTKEFRRN